MTVVIVDREGLRCDLLGRAIQKITGSIVRSQQGRHFGDQLRVALPFVRQQLGSLFCWRVDCGGEQRLDARASLGGDAYAPGSGLARNVRSQ